ncbi:MAG: hypothetical protein JXB29_03060 [Sedimentisphaerales bacterium]|nr:hypothetical protein [Sedimentisphaerales bacterium]
MNVSKTIEIIIIIVVVIVVSIFAGLFLGAAARVGSIVLSFFIFAIPLLIAYLSLKSFKTIIWINVILSISLIIVSGVFAYEKRWTQLLFVPLVFYAFVMFIINLISLFKFWQEYDSEAFIPLLISILTIPLSTFSVKAGVFVNTHVFKERIVQYEAAVKMVENQINTEPLYLIGEDIPAKFRHLAYLIYAKKEGSVLNVSFVWGSGFPNKHTAYVYTSNGKLPEKGTKFQKDWPYYRRINDHWFRVCD